MENKIILSIQHCVQEEKDREGKVNAYKMT